MSDDILRDLGIAAYNAAIQKFCGSQNQKVTREEMENFLNDPRTSFLEDMLDAEGNPKIKPVERGQINPGLAQFYTLAHDQAKEASAMSELLENAEAQSYKDVTALAARIVDANMHQRVNRRLSGPWGYETSIARDATKMLEIAHQLVPQFSEVSVSNRVPRIDEFGDQMIGEDGLELWDEEEQVQSMPWDQAVQAISEGATLIKLGVDALVGPELAKYWSFGKPTPYWRLSTRVRVEPGTTRAITREQQAAVLKQLYVEVFQPFYEAIGRLDLARDYIEMLGSSAGVPAIETKLPQPEEMKAEVQKMQVMRDAQMRQQQEQPFHHPPPTAEPSGEAGGQPLNSPEANTQRELEQVA
jgi:hypothetical protein